MWLWLLLCTGHAQFISTWTTADASETLTLRVFGPNLTIDWGDGVVAENLPDVSTVDHVYESPGNHTISVVGECKFKITSTEAQQLIEISSWGDVFFDSTSSKAFENCVNLQITASGQPTFKPGATLLNCFAYCAKLDAALVWDLTNVVSTSGMFFHASAFNSQLNFTNMGGVTDMSSMFQAATKFNKSVNFDTSGVTTMANMFWNAVDFNQPVEFVTNQVTTMLAMFYNAMSFNQPVRFNTTNVMSFASMFLGAKSFNQLVNFDASNVLKMGFMFSGASSFNQPTTWNVRKVDVLQYMFADCVSLNSPVTFSYAPNLFTVAGMFNGATSFNQNVSLDTSNVTNFGFMFAGASAFNQPITFNTSSALQMESMFENATSFSQPLVFETSKVTRMDRMLRGASSFNQSLHFSDTSKVTDMASMLEGTKFTGDLQAWNVALTNNCSDFCECCGVPLFTQCSPCAGNVNATVEGGLNVCFCASRPSKAPSSAPTQVVSSASTCGPLFAGILSFFVIHGSV